MTTRTLKLTDALRDYLLEVSLDDHPVLRRMREHNEGHPRSSLQIAPEQGQLMALLVRLMGARRAIEIGVFTGYSALVTALALPEDGQLIALDHSHEHTDVARGYWREAKVEHKIDLRLGPALDSLDRMIEAGEQGLHDLAFVDADKSEYLEYVQRLLVLLRPGGLIAVDNVLWYGRVADPGVRDEETEAIREFNRRMHEDPRVQLSMVPIGDGLTLAVKL